MKKKNLFAVATSFFVIHSKLRVNMAKHLGGSSSNLKISESEFNDISECEKDLRRNVIIKEDFCTLVNHWPLCAHHVQRIYLQSSVWNTFQQKNVQG